MAVMRVTILGCGSSGGVPRVGGDWGACDPNEPRNRRTRCGLLLQQWAGEAERGEATTVLIDTPPDLREQLLATHVQRIDAIVFSHDHADQTHGIDDVRAIVHRMRQRIPAFMDEETHASLNRRFSYIFNGERGYPSILAPVVSLKPGQPFPVEGPGGAIVLTPLLQDHGGMASLGFRTGRFAYSNDVVHLPSETLDALDGLDLWIVDALRYAAHPTHAHVERSLHWVSLLKPRHAVLTNLHIDLDYQTLKRELPDGVEPAHDGWRRDLHLT